MKDKLKSFFLNHGEKLGFGLIVVMALFVLWGTRWSPYDKTPQQLLSAADKAKLQIANSDWTPENRQELELIAPKNIMDRQRQLREGVVADPYKFSTSIYTPIFPRSEPIEPPKFQAPMLMIADASEVLIETPPKADEELEGEDAEGDKKEDEDDQSDIPEELRTRPKASTPTEDGFGIASDDCGVSEIYAGGNPSYSGLCGGEGDAASCGDMFGIYGEGGSETVSRNGEGYRFVAIRGVVDWAAQKREYARALHLPPNEAARAEPQIWDFEIQRQKAVSGANPWSGEWETLDIEHSVDVLKKAIDLEADVVDVTVTNSIITEPLPRRVLGVWGRLATHPKITNFVLSPEEQRLEQMRIDKLREAYEALNKNQAQLQEPGGFGRYQVDIRSMQNELSMGGSMEAMESFNSDYQSQMSGFYSSQPGGMPGAGPGRAGGFPGGRPGAPGEQPNLLASARSAASGRLLLFRYFDFEVEPGAVYRYRVRFEYLNPNFNKPIELLASPELAEGQTRTSDWSEPTPAVQVKPEAEYFLADVEYETKRRTDVAAMEVYKWNAATGTVVNELRRFAVGDEIGGLLDTKVVNPLEETFEEEKIKVNTGDLLIDLRKDDELKIDGQLPDLGKVPKGVRFDEVLVMNSNGNLETFDRFTREIQRIKAEKFQKIQDDIGREYEKAAREAAEGDDLLYPGGGDCGEGMMTSDMMRPPSSSAARGKRRRPRYSSGGGGACGP